MVKDLKKRLNQYIEKYHKKGYSIEQIKKALIIYGFEPSYVEEVIAEYKSRRITHIILLFIVLSLLIVIKPAVTGYYLLSEHITFLRLNVVYIVSLLVIVPLILLIGFDKVELKFAIEKIRASLNRLKSARFKFPALTKGTEEEYKETNPLISLYAFLSMVSVLIAIISLFFKNFKLMAFGIIGIIFAFIGYKKVKKMYYKEV